MTPEGLTKLLAFLATPLVVAGFLLKYLVWNFYQQPENLRNTYREDILLAQAAIEGRVYLPCIQELLVQIEDYRRERGLDAPMDQLLLLAQVKDIISRSAEAIGRRDLLGRHFETMQGAAGRIWKFWLLASLLIIGIAPGFSGVISYAIWALLVLSYLLVGCVVLGVYYLIRFTVARTALVRELNRIDFGDLNP